jgi:site-specific DNA-cytosine methylase
MGLEDQHALGGAGHFVPTWWDGGDLAASVTTRSNGQLMPDKGNFAAVLESFRKSKRAQTADDDETWVDDGVANTLNGFDTGDVRTTHAIAFAQNQRGEVRDLGNQTGALSGPGTHQTTHVAVGGTNTSGPSLMCGMSVRRLTPTECERLQGFPDGWTDGQADSHRYKQLGNAVTVNVAEWIARRTRTWMQSRS